MSRILPLAFLFAVTVVSQPAWAHFVWLVSQPTNSGTQVQAFFSETPEADSAEFLKKIAAMKVVCRVTGKDALPVSLREQSRGETGSLDGQCDAARPLAFEGSVVYGVSSRGGSTFLLQYYARHLAADSAASFEKLARGGVDLDIVPRRDGDQLELVVLWQGKPVEGAQVMAAVGDGKPEELKTDAKGAVRTKVAAGLYAVRARHIEAGKEGTLGDKKYGEVRHYSTLTFQLPLAPEAK